MADFLAIEWLEAVHQRCADRLALMVGVALLDGLSDHAEVAAAVRMRTGLGATTPDRVDRAVQDLIGSGLLAEVFRAPCAEDHDHALGCEELVLEFRLPESE